MEQLPRILILDDEVVVLKALRNELSPLKCHVEVFYDEVKALDRMRKSTFDIVYTDLIMNVMDGVEVCRAVKSLSKDTDVVMISGHPVEILNRINDFIKAGGRREYLKKPLNDGELIKLTEQILLEKKGFLKKK